MTGAKNLTVIDNGLGFKFKMCKKSNYCKITLNGLDLYDIEFGKIRKYEYSVVSNHSNIYL